MLNVLTVDVEESFHATEMAVGQGQWTSLPSRIEHQLHKTLQTLERKSVRGTFFILGWVADHYPHLVREVLSAGHEIGCHSYSHRLVYNLTPDEFRQDTRRATVAIQEAGGVTPRIYRAPSYSITQRSLWALEILAECGFTHDSSIYPIAHDRYGIPGSKRKAHMVHTPGGTILEVPAATVELSMGRVLPIGGGGYMRLLPYRYSSAGIRRVNTQEQTPVCIYFHPWELDPEQVRIPLGLISRLRTYGGLRGMQTKLEQLLNDFSFSTMSAVYPQVRDYGAAGGMKSPIEADRLTLKES